MVLPFLRELYYHGTSKLFKLGYDIYSHLTDIANSIVNSDYRLRELSFKAIIEKVTSRNINIRNFTSNNNQLYNIYTSY